jgi:S-adenosylmethionine decarboxylase
MRVNTASLTIGFPRESGTERRTILTPALTCHTADQLGCTTRAQVIEPFQPHGATCVLILAESHITVSTWPEHHLAHIDVFTCRADSAPDRAIQPILDLLAGQVTHTQNVPRIPPGCLLPQP